MDMKKFHFPIFREEDESKWRTKLGFSMKDWNPKKTTFQSIAESLPTPGENPFVDGSVPIGIRALMRKRLQEKEVGSVPFSGTLPNDPWKNTLNKTSTLRSQKSIEASLSFSQPFKSNVVYNLPVIQESSINDHTITARSSALGM